MTNKQTYIYIFNLVAQIMCVFFMVLLVLCHQHLPCANTFIYIYIYSYIKNISTECVQSAAKGNTLTSLVYKNHPCARPSSNAPLTGGKKSATTRGVLFLCMYSSIYGYIYIYKSGCSGTNRTHLPTKKKNLYEQIIARRQYKEGSMKCEKSSFFFCC